MKKNPFAIYSLRRPLSVYAIVLAQPLETLPPIVASVRSSGVLVLRKTILVLSLALVIGRLPVLAPAVAPTLHPALVNTLGFQLASVEVTSAAKLLARLNVHVLAVIVLIFTSICTR